MSQPREDPEAGEVAEYRADARVCVYLFFRFTKVTLLQCSATFRLVYSILQPQTRLCQHNLLHTGSCLPIVSSQLVNLTCAQENCFTLEQYVEGNLIRPSEGILMSFCHSFSSLPFASFARGKYRCHFSLQYHCRCCLFAKIQMFTKLA